MTDFADLAELAARTFERMDEDMWLRRHPDDARRMARERIAEIRTLLAKGGEKGEHSG